MSRDPFFHNPQEPRELRDAPAGRTERQHKPAASDERDAVNPATEPSVDRESLEARKRHPIRDEREDFPRAYYLRDRSYHLRDSQMHSLEEIGKFRVIAVEDLAKHAYGGDRGRMVREIGQLARQHLVTDKTVEIPQKNTLRVVTLTKAGHRLLRKTNQVPDNQPIYHGLAKPREIKHDADLYRLYQKEADRIEQGGGRLVRVILDYELKRNLNRDLALLEPQKDALSAKEGIAEKHGLAVVNGKIPVPDLRIEYEAPELELRHVDLELATREYRPRAIAAKAAAGFSIYGRSEDASRLRRILDEREITARILTL